MLSSLLERIDDALKLFNDYPLVWAFTELAFKCKGDKLKYQKLYEEALVKL